MISFIIQRLIAIKFNLISKEKRNKLKKYTNIFSRV